MKVFILIDGVQQGPYTHEQLEQMNLAPDTYVWHKGLPEWQRAAQCQETAYLFAGMEQTPAFEPAEPQAAESVPPVYEQPQAVPQTPAAPSQPEFEPISTYHAPESDEPAEEIPPMPQQYIALSIITLVCCCVPLGIIALIYGNKVSTSWKMGDYEDAEKNSKIAKWCSVGGMIGGFVIIALYISLLIVSGVLEQMMR